MSSLPDCFTPFQSLVGQIPLPKKFTFPFYYEPHELSRVAAKELQQRLSRNEFEHNFGLDGNPDGLVIGKMFGVLVVRSQSGQLGYLSAFSGKLANSNHHKGFVPPVFDILVDGDFFLEGSEQLNVYTAKIEELEAAPEYIELQKSLKSAQTESEREIESFREHMRQRKAARKETRESLEAGMNATERAIIENDLIRESLSKKHELKVLMTEWQRKIETLQSKIDTHKQIIDVYRKQRKELSGMLQHQIFESYQFLNADGKARSLFSIFKEYTDSEPPAGAGECAAPKLLHYAFEHNLEPIALAEFWWGASPKSEVRKHQHFYPSCRGKCEPILGHMLKGLNVEANPMLEKPEVIAPLDIVYEDDVLVIINKPADFLSVPGKSDLPSVYVQVKAKYPDATGPLIVHRLDMATSGILLFTKTKEANKFMQEQFISKTVKKRYVAILDGIVENDEGTIYLPLRLDLDDRPRQLVCQQFGKSAITRFKVVDRLYGKTRVHFFPETGRTHQLRVHAAHSEGLNTPILGDDLYGTKDKRLHLHAEELTFTHPITKESKTIIVPAPF